MRKYLPFIILVIPLLACTIVIPPFPTSVVPATADPLQPPTPTLATSLHGEDTLAALWQVDLPAFDPYDFAQRYEGKSYAEALPPVTTIRQVGERDAFWVTYGAETPATLRNVTEHAYFWVQDGVSYDHNALLALGETFESTIYPRTRDIFGSEWNPGVDGDPRIYIVYTDDETGSGSFPTYAEINPEFDPESDGHEIIFLSTSSRLDEDYLYGVLAHEFQHVIHYNVDPNEELWLEEGLSELAAYRLGYDLGGFDRYFTRNPDIRLLEWPDDNTSAYYGSGALFAIYFQQRFGEDALRALVADPRNGIRSVEAVLTERQIVDPLTGQPVHADDLFLDFAIMLYLDDPAVADGRYALPGYPDLSSVQDTDYSHTCPMDITRREVNQYGIDYLGIACPGEHTLHFQGATAVDLLPTEPHSGEYAMWSNRGINSDMTLTCAFDFSSQSGPLTFKYWTWYDTESSYDMVYLTALGEGDATWTNLLATSPSDIYAGYTGSGTTWQEQTVDLSRFAGRRTQVRFEYVVDYSIYGDGFLVDDISIPETGYTTDFESGPDCWQAEGFARVQTSLPQTFRLALIIHGPNGTRVEIVTVAPDQSAAIPLHLVEGEQATIVVMATNPFALQPASYDYRVTAP
ncbi:MAG: immune inhibitor A [Anaerolineales bacterium]|nr:immune inhibitor A [Anaerolineales bacterium]